MKADKLKFYYYLGPWIFDCSTVVLNRKLQIVGRFFFLIDYGVFYYFQIGITTIPGTQINLSGSTKLDFFV